MESDTGELERDARALYSLLHGRPPPLEAHIEVTSSHRAGAEGRAEPGRCERIARTAPEEEGRTVSAEGRGFRTEGSKIIIPRLEHVWKDYGVFAYLCRRAQRQTYGEVKYWPIRPGKAIHDPFRSQSNPSKELCRTGAANIASSTSEPGERTGPR